MKDELQGARRLDGPRANGLAAQFSAGFSAKSVKSRHLKRERKKKENYYFCTRTSSPLEAQDKKIIQENRWETLESERQHRGYALSFVMQNAHQVVTELLQLQTERKEINYLER